MGRLGSIPPSPPSTPNAQKRFVNYNTQTLLSIGNSRASLSWSGSDDDSTATSVDTKRSSQVTHILCLFLPLSLSLPISLFLPLSHTLNTATNIVLSILVVSLRTTAPLGSFMVAYLRVIALKFCMWGTLIFPDRGSARLEAEVLSWKACLKSYTRWAPSV